MLSGKTAQVSIWALVLACFVWGCRQRELKRAFQGTWYKEGFDVPAFSVRGDSLYYPGLPKGYPYRFHKDTLEVRFSKKTTRSPILSFSRQSIEVWDMDVSGDTLLLSRKPAVDSLGKF